jgi:hypothetical protein
MTELLDSQVFLPVHDDSIAGIQRSSAAQPVAMQAEDGTPVPAVFTSPERAHDFLNQVPGKSGGLENLPGYRPL